MAFIVESKKTLENLKFKVDNNMKMSTGPGRRCLVSLCVLSLEKGCKPQPRERRLSEVHHYIFVVQHCTFIVLRRADGNIEAIGDKDARNPATNKPAMNEVRRKSKWGGE